MKISIITPVYNSALTIERTILSIINQKYEDLEYIIVDGGSKDNTLDIINKYKKFITKIISESDRGISDAYNKGIKIATGELIGIVAADDELLVDSLKRLANSYDGHSDVVSGNVIIKGDYGYYIVKSSVKISELKERTSLKHPATYIRKSAYQKYGLYDLEFKCAMDRELLTRYYIKGATFQVIDETLSLFYRGGISTKNPCKLAYIEDMKVSVKYGLNWRKAQINLIKSSCKFYITLFIKKVINLFFLNKFLTEKFSNRYLSEEILESMILNYYNFKR